MTERLGVQLAPSRPSRELALLGQRFANSVDMVWVQDQMLARNAYVLLAALAGSGCGVGTNVTYSVGRNPIEMASAAATITELLAPGKECTIGIGTGGAIVKSLFLADKALSNIRETINLMQSLWSGAAVQLDDFPTLGQRLGYRPGAVAQLTYPVAAPPSIVIAGVGPKILSIAGELADGLISPSNLPTQSLAAFRSGRYDELAGLDHVRRARPAGAPPIRLIFGINVSVSRDRERARDHARRQLALVLGHPGLWADLAAVGLDVESAGDVKAAFDAGLGIEGAAGRVSDNLTDALIVAGTPEECIGRIAELRDLAAAHGYTEFYLGAPLGPDPFEAAELLCNEVIPRVWPERLGSAA